MNTKAVREQVAYIEHRLSCVANDFRIADPVDEEIARAFPHDADFIRHSQQYVADLLGFVKDLLPEEKELTHRRESANISHDLF